MRRKLSLLALMFCLISKIAYALPNPAQDPRVQKVYEYLKDPLIWVREGKWTPCGEKLLDALSRVDQEGLWLEDYAPLLDALQKADFSSSEGQKRADQLLTLAALNYISDMKGERLNPKSVARTIHLQQVEIDEVDLLKEYVSLSNQCSWIHGLAPSSSEYQRLKQLLALYRQKKVLGGWLELPKGTKLERGEDGPLVETLRAQLIAQDALPSEGQGSDVFDEALENALKKYQELHGLESDGKVGPETLKALNMSVDDRIRSIIVSMEHGA